MTIMWARMVGRQHSDKGLGLAQHFNTETNDSAAGSKTHPVVPVWLGQASAADGQAQGPRKGKAFGIAVGAALAALAVSYALGVYHYQTHFLPGVTVGGVEASELTIAQVAQQVEDNINSFTTHVTGDGMDFTVTAEDAALTVNGKALAEDAHHETNPFAWPLKLWSHDEITVDAGVTYDPTKLHDHLVQVIEEFNQTAEAPTNATAVYDSEQGSYVLQPSALGTMVDAEAASEVIAKSVAALKPTATLTEDQLQRAQILDDNEGLLAAIDQANSIAALSVPLTLDGQTLITVGPDLITGWINITQDGETTSVSVDEDAIREWSYANLNSIVNGENETRVWEVNSWDVASELAPRLQNADGSAMEIPTITISTRPAESEGHESRGRHIDVNLSTQYARLYDSDGRTVLWRSYFVSGNESMGHSTPTGDYEINNMERDVVLTGLNDGVVLEEGEEPKPEDYYNSHVAYWMCWLGTEYGFHDATWRSDEEFGGDTYQWNGSHGCINLPYDSAAELYSLIHVGDKVHIHY